MFHTQLLGISFARDICFGDVKPIPNYWDINPNPWMGVFNMGDGIAGSFPQIRSLRTLKPMYTGTASSCDRKDLVTGVFCGKSAEIAT